jgi:peroxiredoxin
MNNHTLMPRQPVPRLSVGTLAGERWTLAERSPRHFTMIVFYRGMHCPVCRRYLAELNAMADKFAERGVEVVVISTDVEERARRTQSEWGLDKLTIGYELGIGDARQWGLFVSASRGKTSIGVEEPALFSEPGLFLVRPDGMLYWSNVSTMPFARPHFDDILGGIDFVLKNNYPARGES